MKTAFAEWLEARGEMPWRYAQRNHISRYTVYMFAGQRSACKLATNQPASFSVANLKFIARDTGIPIERLVADVIATVFPEGENDDGAQTQGAERPRRPAQRRGGGRDRGGGADGAPHGRHRGA